MKAALRFTLGLVIAAMSLPALAGEDATVPEQRSQTSSEATADDDRGGGSRELAGAEASTANDAAAQKDAAIQEYYDQQTLNQIWANE